MGNQRLRNDAAKLSTRFLKTACRQCFETSAIGNMMGHSLQIYTQLENY